MRVVYVHPQSPKFGGSTTLQTSDYETPAALNSINVNGRYQLNSTHLNVPLTVAAMALLSGKAGKTVMQFRAILSQTSFVRTLPRIVCFAWLCRHS
jgi:hypothetical protein